MESEAIFWERLRGMPDVEAEQELITRREGVLNENMETMALKRKLGRYGDNLGKKIQENNAQLALLNDALRVVRVRMDRVNWRRAVMAVCGPEAYEQCAIWVETNCIEPGREGKTRHERG